MDLGARNKQWCLRQQKQRSLGLPMEHHLTQVPLQHSCRPLSLTS